MSLEQIQRDCDTWVMQYKIEYFAPFEILAVLVEELAELSQEIEYHERIATRPVGEKESSVGKELADILFAAVCMANSHKINLDYEWSAYMSTNYYPVSETSSLQEVQNVVGSIMYRESESFTPSNMRDNLMLAYAVVARELLHSYGIKPKKSDEAKGSVGQGLAGIIFGAASIANHYEVGLELEWNQMVEKKLKGRDKDRHEKK